MCSIVTIKILLLHLAILNHLLFIHLNSYYSATAEQISMLNEKKKKKMAYGVLTCWWNGGSKMVSSSSTKGKLRVTSQGKVLMNDTRVSPLARGTGYVVCMEDVIMAKQSMKFCKLTIVLFEK